MKSWLKLFPLFFLSFSSLCQLPSKPLVGYLENWNTLRLSQAHANYNVLCLAFALPVNYPTPGYDMRFALPAGYASVAQLVTDIDLMHSQGKVVLLSIGGATGPIKLNNATERTTFINSINAIFSTYSYKIDGIDMDLETSGSMGFGAWTMSSPATAQTNMVTAIQSIMANYLSTTGKKMILTMAPEVIYLMGGLSTWQVDNVNGGAFLPILHGLRNELDLLHMQLYNAGGAGGGVYAWNGSLYYDNGTPDFALAMNESIIKGFTLVYGKGTFTGIPANKLAFGLPATSAFSTAGTGYLTPSEVCDAARYFKGEISKPASVTYTMSAFYPGLQGLMTWSINEDYTSINGQWNFASNFTCAFPASLPVELIRFDATQQNQQVQLQWELSNTSTYKTVRVEMLDGEEALEIARLENHVRSYTVPTAALKTGTMYFRLVFEDYDGSLQFSEVKSVMLNALSFRITNSFSESIRIYCEQSFYLELQDLNGAVVLRNECVSGETDLAVLDLPAGAYIATIYGDGGTFQVREKLVKVH